MATVTNAVTAVASTSNAATYATGSFTPAAEDLLVVFAVASGTTLAGTVTDSLGGTYTKITSVLKNASADTVYAFVGNQFAAASAMTVTFGTGGAAATGAVVCVARVAGMSLKGASSVRQSASQANQAASGTPAPAFTISALTGNPTLGVVGNSTSPATLTPPTSWTEQSDVGYSTPTTGGEYVSRDSGFTGTTITWGSTSASAFGDIIIELDTSTVPTGAPLYEPYWETSLKQVVSFNAIAEEYDAGWWLLLAPSSVSADMSLFKFSRAPREPAMQDEYTSPWTQDIILSNPTFDPSGGFGYQDAVALESQLGHLPSSATCGLEWDDRFLILAPSSIASDTSFMQALRTRVREAMTQEEYNGPSQIILNSPPFDASGGFGYQDHQLEGQIPWAPPSAKNAEYNDRTVIIILPPPIYNPGNGYGYQEEVVDQQKLQVALQGLASEQEDHIKIIVLPAFINQDHIASIDEDN